MGSAARWADELAAWRIDDAIVAAAPEDPYRLDPALFAVAPGAGTALHRLAAEALPEGGSVLDVGCGTGAASLPLAPPAARVTGVDTSPEMLARFAEVAAGRGVAVTTVPGGWPEAAPRAGTADVVVCQHVAYNVADLVPFVAALTAAARHRVVLAVHERHPWVPLGPLWEAVHGQPRPAGPTADLLGKVLAEAGLRVQRVDGTTERAERPRALLVAATRRRLCLPAERDPEVEALLGPDPDLSPRAVATFAWDGSA